MKILPRLFLLALATTFSAFAFAAESEISFDFRKNIRHSGEWPEGFLLSTGLRIPFSFSHSQSRLGVDNGNYIDLAARLKSSLHYRRGLHDWSTSGFLGESYSMTPTIKNRLIKTQDLLRIESRYLYNVLPWLSAYAHARMETSILKSIDIDSIENDYELRNVDNTLREKIKAKEYHIADPFRPLFFQENLGLAAGIIEKEFFNWEGRTAMSFRQTIANNQRVFVGEVNKVRIVRDLQSFFQIGPMLGTSVGGELFDKRVEYICGIDAMWPFWQRPKPVNRDFWHSINVEANAGIVLKLTSWSSLSYEYNLVRIPDILEKFQQNHTLTLDIKVDWLYTFGQPEGQA